MSAHDQCGDWCHHLAPFDKPRGARRPDGQMVVCMAAHLEGNGTSCGVVAFMSREDVWSGTAICSECGETFHYDLSEDPDFFGWALQCVSA